MKTRECGCPLMDSEIEDARLRGSGARRGQRALEDCPYPGNPQHGCSGVLAGACCLANAWREGFAREERTMYEELRRAS